MIRYLLFTAAFLLIVGPLRKPLFSAWRLVLPLAVGGIIGWYVVNSIRFLGAPGWMLWFGPFFCAFVIGGALMELFDDFMPPKR